MEDLPPQQPPPPPQPRKGNQGSAPGGPKKEPKKQLWCATCFSSKHEFTECQNLCARCEQHYGGRCPVAPMNTYPPVSARQQISSVAALEDHVAGLRQRNHDERMEIRDLKNQLGVALADNKASRSGAMPSTTPPVDKASAADAPEPMDLDDRYPHKLDSLGNAIQPGLELFKNIPEVQRWADIVPGWMEMPKQLKSFHKKRLNREAVRDKFAPNSFLLAKLKEHNLR